LKVLAGFEAKWPDLKMAVAGFNFTQPERVYLLTVCESNRTEYRRRMPKPDHYRALAAELDARAQHEADPLARIEWLLMAASYRRLADLAERNARTDVFYEPPIERPNVAQQQQQIQPKDDVKE
jgi:hypothetical protein